jgi:hypothetical protein
VCSELFLSPGAGTREAEVAGWTETRRFEAFYQYLCNWMSMGPNEASRRSVRWPEQDRQCFRNVEETEL